MTAGGAAAKPCSRKRTVKIDGNNRGNFIDQFPYEGDLPALRFTEGSAAFGFSLWHVICCLDAGISTYTCSLFHTITRLLQRSGCHDSHRLIHDADRSARACVHLPDLGRRKHSIPRVALY